MERYLCAHQKLWVNRSLQCIRYGHCRGSFRGEYGGPLPLQSVQSDSKHRGRWLERLHLTFFPGKASVVLSQINLAGGISLKGDRTGNAFAGGAD
jgi:hypothetical protein